MSPIILSQGFTKLQCVAVKTLHLDTPNIHERRNDFETKLFFVICRKGLCVSDVSCEKSGI